jgi:hypothetical protein
VEGGQKANFEQKCVVTHTLTTNQHKQHNRTMHHAPLLTITKQHLNTNTKQTNKP